MKNSLITAIALIVLSGCSPHNLGPAFSADTIRPNSTTGTVVFYRPHQFNFMGLNQPIGRWGIAGNDKTITAVGDSTYSKVELAPGLYKFHAETTAIDTIEDIDIKANKIHYVKVFSRGFGGGWFTYILFKEVDEQTALQELKGLALQINLENS